MFSKACQYAINSMIFLAAIPEDVERVGLKEIASAIHSPEAFTAKILQTLVKENFLTSIKGPNGGFKISDLGRNVPLYRIIQSIDGESIFLGCALGLNQCSEERPCAIHYRFKSIRDHYTGTMMTTTIEDLALGIKEGVGHLKY